jgi:ABC-2 type transport system permease protein
MRRYWEVFKFNLLAEFAYPIDISAFIVRKLVNLGFQMLFWFVVSKANPAIFNFKQILSYFLIAGAVEDLSFTSGSKFGREIQRKISNGYLSNYIIKPMDTLRFLFVSFAGGRSSVTLYALITLLIGIYVYPPRELINLLLFPISLVLTTMTGTGINILIGIVGFYSPEGSSIRNVYEQISAILSGAYIPLTYFPLALRNIITFMPFPVLTFFPVTILQTGGLNYDTFLKLGISLFWASVILYGANMLWKRSVKNYQGAGI